MADMDTRSSTSSLSVGQDQNHSVNSSSASPFRNVPRRPPPSIPVFNSQSVRDTPAHLHTKKEILPEPEFKPDMIFRNESQYEPNRANLDLDMLESSSSPSTYRWSIMTMLLAFPTPTPSPSHHSHVGPFVPSQPNTLSSSSMMQSQTKGFHGLSRIASRSFPSLSMSSINASASALPTTTPTTRDGKSIPITFSQSGLPSPSPTTKSTKAFLFTSPSASHLSSSHGSQTQLSSIDDRFHHEEVSPLSSTFTKRISVPMRLASSSTYITNDSTFHQLDLYGTHSFPLRPFSLFRILKSPTMDSVSNSRQHGPLPNTNQVEKPSPGTHAAPSTSNKGKESQMTSTTTTLTPTTNSLHLTKSSSVIRRPTSHSFLRSRSHTHSVYPKAHPTSPNSPSPLVITSPTTPTSETSLMSPYHPSLSPLSDTAHEDRSAGSVSSPSGIKSPSWNPSNTTRVSETSGGPSISSFFPSSKSSASRQRSPSSPDKSQHARSSSSNSNSSSRNGLFRRLSNRSKTTRDRDLTPSPPHPMVKQSFSEAKMQLPAHMEGNEEQSPYDKRMSVGGGMSPRTTAYASPSGEGRPTLNLSFLKHHDVKRSASHRDVPLTPITPNLQAPKHYNYLESATKDNIDFSELVRRPSYLKLSPTDQSSLFPYLTSLTPSSLIAFQKSSRKFLNMEEACHLADIDVDTYTIDCVAVPIDEEDIDSPVIGMMEGKTLEGSPRRPSTMVDHGDFNRLQRDRMRVNVKWVGSVTLSAKGNGTDPVLVEWELPFDGSEKCDVSITPSSATLRASAKKPKLNIQFTVFPKTLDPVEFVAILNVVDGHRHFFVVRVSPPSGPRVTTGVVGSSSGIANRNAFSPTQQGKEEGMFKRVSQTMGPILSSVSTGTGSGIPSPPAFDSDSITSSCLFPDASYDIPVYLSLLLNLLLGKKGFESVGIFREKGIPWEIETLDASLKQGILPACHDVYAIATCMKMYFRNSSTKLFSDIQPEAMMSAKDDHECWSLLKTTFHQDQRTLHLLQWMIDLLCKVVLHQETNRMSVQAIATAWAPNLLNGLDPMESVGRVQLAIGFLVCLVNGRLRILQAKRVIMGGVIPASSAVLMSPISPINPIYPWSSESLPSPKSP